MPDEVILYEAHPSMFRNQPVAFVLCCLLSLVGVGLIILLVWWVRCKGTELTITDKRTTLRRGIFSKYTNEVMHTHVRNVQTWQTFLQRMLGVGTVGIACSGTEGVEILVHGMPDPEGIRRIIDQHRPA